MNHPLFPNTQADGSNQLYTEVDLGGAWWFRVTRTSSGRLRLQVYENATRLKMGPEFEPEYLLQVIAALVLIAERG